MAVTCAYHRKAEAVGACVNCGKLVCNECKVTLKGKIYCNPCMEEMYAEKSLKADTMPAASTVVVKSLPERGVTRDKAKEEAKPTANVKTTAKTEASPVTTDNTSGQGKDAIFPEELKGFNTGAFLMNWIWSIGNKVWIGLLALVPIPLITFIIAIVLGIKGNEWAWQNKTWNSIEHFKKVQRTWMWVGIALLIVSLVIGALAAAIAVLYSSGGEIQFE